MPIAAYTPRSTRKTCFDLKDVLDEKRRVDEIKQAKLNIRKNAKEQIRSLTMEQRAREMRLRRLEAQIRVDEEAAAMEDYQTSP